MIAIIFALAAATVQASCNSPALLDHNGMTCESNNYDSKWRSSNDCTSVVLGSGGNDYGVDMVWFTQKATVTLAKPAVINQVDVELASSGLECAYSVQYYTGSGGWSTACTLKPDSSGKNTCVGRFPTSTVTKVRIYKGATVNCGDDNWFGLSGLKLYECGKATEIPEASCNSGSSFAPLDRSGITCESNDRRVYRSSNDCTSEVLGSDLFAWGPGKGISFTQKATVTLARPTVITQLDVHYFRSSTSVVEGMYCAYNVEYDTGNGVWLAACSLTADSSGKNTCAGSFPTSAVAKVRISKGATVSCLSAKAKERDPDDYWFHLTGLNLYACEKSTTITTAATKTTTTTKAATTTTTTAKATTIGTTTKAGETNQATNHYRKETGVGGWGGICTCPDGQKYEVGDNNDKCASLACEGGVAGVCSNSGISAANKSMKVTCGTASPASPHPRTATTTASGTTAAGSTATTSTRATSSTAAPGSTTTTTTRPTSTAATPATIDLTGDFIIMASGTAKEAVSEAVKAVLVTTLHTSSIEIVSITEGSPTTTTSLRKQNTAESHYNEEGSRRLSAKQYVVTWKATVLQVDAEKTKVKLNSNEFKGALTKQLETAGAANVTIAVAGSISPVSMTTIAPSISAVASGSVKFSFSPLLAMIGFCANVVVLSSNTVA